MPDTSVDFTPLPQLMNAIPYKTIWDTHRYIVSRGGAGSGKSHGHAQKIIYYTTACPGRNTLVIREVSETNRISTFPLLKKVIYDFNLGSLYTIRESDLTITCVNGNQIIFKGLDSAEKIKSVTFARGILTDIWVEEATETKEEAVDQLDLRLRGQTEHKFQMTLTFNPVDSMHWIKRKFYDEKDDRAACYLSTYKDNKWIDEESKKNLELLEEKNPYLYQVYTCGKWGNAGDIVFQNVRYERCTYKEEDFDEVCAGQDFGYSHYNAITLTGFKDGNAYTYKELYLNNKLISDIIAENERRGVLKKTQLCVCDCAEPKSIGDWRNAGYSILEAKKPPDAKRTQLQYLAGINWTIDPVTCPGLAAEVRGFSYRKDKNGVVREIDEAQGIRDDAIDSVRYAISRKIKNTRFVLI